MPHKHIGNIDDVSVYMNGLLCITCEYCHAVATVQIKDSDWNEGNY